MRTLSVKVVAAGPSVPRDGSEWVLRPGIGHEVAMVKAALLYADFVDIASPHVGSLALMASALTADKRGDSKELAVVLEVLTGRQEGASDANESDAVAAFATKADEFQRRLDDLEHDPAWRELELAMDAGLIGIAPMPGGGAVETVAQVLHALKHMNPLQGQVPLVDPLVGRIIRAGLNTGALQQAEISGVQELGLASALMATMPAFPDARMDVLLDVRRSLRQPLVVFRAAMAEYAADVSSIPGDRAFAAEVSEIYREKVAPKLADLEESGKEGRLWHALRTEVSESHGGRALTGAAGFGIAAAVGMPTLVQAAVTAAAIGLDIAGSAKGRLRQVAESRRENGLLWLYEADRALLEKWA